MTRDSIRDAYVNNNNHFEQQLEWRDKKQNV